MNLTRRTFLRGMAAIAVGMLLPPDPPLRWTPRATNRSGS